MLTLDRRDFLQTTAVAAFTAAATAYSSFDDARASTPGSSAEAPGFYRFALGDFQIALLCDGVFVLPTDSFATNVRPEEKKPYFDAHYLAPDMVQLQASPLLIDAGQKRILVDTGLASGTDWAAWAGRLTKTLTAAGIGAHPIGTVAQLGVLQL